MICYIAHFASYLCVCVYDCMCMSMGGFVRVHSGQTAFALFHPHLLLLRLLLLYFLILALFIFKNSSFTNQQPVSSFPLLSIQYSR